MFPWIVTGARFLSMDEQDYIMYRFSSDVYICVNKEFEIELKVSAN